MTSTAQGQRSKRSHLENRPFFGETFAKSKGAGGHDVIDLFTRVGASVLLLVGGGLYLFAGGPTPTPHADGAPVDAIILSGGELPAANTLDVPGLSEVPKAAAFTPSAVPPVSGSCDVLNPDPGFVDEMLVRFSEDGSKSFERRVALVIGNGAYEGAIGTLDNPANDATSMANVMSALGFTVYRGIDLDADGIEKCLGRFTAELQSKPTDVALFFYAGHGIQLVSETDNEKRNYMMATDARIAASGEGVGYKQIDAVLNQMRDHSEQSVFFYDACRNYPLGDQRPDIIDGVAIKRGIALVSGPAAVTLKQQEADDRAGIYIAYATAPNRVADDAYEKNANHSPFTQALLNHIATPGMPLETVMNQVTLDVVNYTDSEQVPWKRSSLQNDVKINGKLQARDTQAKSSSLAASSDKSREAGAKSASIVHALKGLPRKQRNLTSRPLFEDAHISLYRTLQNGNQILSGHNGYVTGVAFGPGDNEVLSGSWDRTLKIWEKSSGRVLREITLSNDVSSFDFSTDRSYVLTGSNKGTPKLWNIKTGALVRQFPVLRCAQDRFCMVNAKLSNDGRRILAYGQFNVVIVFDAFSGSVIARINDGAGSFRAATFSPDGRLIATGKETSGVKVWNAQNGNFVRSFSESKSITTDIKFSPDGKLLAASSNDSALRVWDLKDGNLVSTHHVLRAINNFTFSPNGRYIAGAFRNEIRITHTGSGTLQALIDDIRGQIYDIAFNSDGSSILMGMRNFNVRVLEWRPRSDFVFLKSESPASFAAGFNSTGTHAAISEVSYRFLDGKIIYDTNLISVWDVTNGRLVGSEKVAGEDQIVLAFSPDRDFFATGSRKGKFTLWRIDDEGKLEITKSEKIADSAIVDITFDPEGNIVAAGKADGSVASWEARTGALRGVTSLSDNPIVAVGFGADGTLIALDTAGNVFKNGVSVSRLEFESDDHRMRSADISNSGLWAVGDGAVGQSYLWDIGSGEQLLSLDENQSVITGVSFGPHDHRVATSSWYNDRGSPVITVWSTANGEIVSRFRVPSGNPLGQLDFSPKSSNVISALGGGGGAVVWDVGIYGPDLVDAAYDLLTPELRAEVERERIRYWEVDPAVLQ